MLTAEDLPFVRYMNSEGDGIDNFVDPNTSKRSLSFGTFLPTHSYPVMTPGYTAHWSSDTVVIVSRSSETGRMIFCINCSNLPKEILFNNSSISKKTKTGRKVWWFNGLGKWNIFDYNPAKRLETVEIFAVLPLMIEATLFDALIVVKRSVKKERNKTLITSFGFIRVKQLIDERTALSTQYAALPSLECENESDIEEEFEFLNYKHFLLVIFMKTGRIRIINLNFSYYDEHDNNNVWSRSLEGEERGLNCGIKTAILCPNEQESDDFNFYLLFQSCKNEIFLSKISFLSSSSLNYSFKFLFQRIPIPVIDTNLQLQKKISLSFIKNEFLYLIAGSTVTEVCIKNYFSNPDLISSKNKIRTLKIPFLSHADSMKRDRGDSNTIIYSFPWQLDLKCSALIYSLIDTSDGEIVIKVCSVDVDSSKNDNWLIAKDLLTSDRIKISDDFNNLDLFASSSFELFIMEKDSRKVFIYSGLLIESDWNWSGRKDPVGFEFSQWFDIFNDFPTDLLNQYQLNDDKNFFINHLLNDLDLSAKTNILFPPNSWQGMSTLCRALKGYENVTIPYLLLLMRTPREKIEQFYNYYSLTRREVGRIELFYHLDCKHWEEALRIILSGQCGIDLLNGQVFEDIVNVLSVSHDLDHLDQLAKFTAGRLISIDVLIEKELTCKILMKSILFKSGLFKVLDWIKGLFAWLRPEDRSAAIPVPLLHKQFLGVLIEVILEIKDSEEFKAIGRELVEMPFEREMLESVLDKLKGELDDNGDDRAAWLITLICAARGKWHDYLKRFDFSAVKDPEVYRGIQLILEVLKSSDDHDQVQDHDPLLQQSSKSTDFTEDKISFSSALSFVKSTSTTTNYQKHQVKNLDESMNDSADAFISYYNPIAAAKNTFTPNHHSFLTSPIQYRHGSASDSSSTSSTAYMAKLYKNGSPTLSPTPITFLSQVKSSPPPFTPKHFPSKKPTRLSSLHHAADEEVDINHRKEEEEEEVEIDPFMEDLFRNYGKRARNLNDLLKDAVSDSSSSMKNHNNYNNTSHSDNANSKRMKYI